MRIRPQGTTMNTSTNTSVVPRASLTLPSPGPRLRLGPLPGRWYTAGGLAAENDQGDHRQDQRGEPVTGAVARPHRLVGPGHRPQPLGGADHEHPGQLGRAGHGYLTIAVGRDYGDVSPTSGTFEADFPGRLSSSRRVGVTAVEYGLSRG